MNLLISESGSGYGGSARYLFDLVSGLDQSRFHLRIAAAEDGPWIRRIRAQGVPVTLAPRWQSCWKIPAIWIWLKRHRIRLVHLNNEIYSHLPLLLAARLAGCRLLCHLHGWRGLTRMERWAARFVDEWVCVSDSGARFYRQQLPGRRILAVPNGLSLNGQTSCLDAQREFQRRELGLGKDDIGVVTVGRLVPEKGQAIILNALALASRQEPRLTGILVGQDPDPNQRTLTHLRQMAQSLGIQDRVRFLPWADDVWPVYGAADLVVQPSVKPEGFGLVILEAMAARRPVIATRAGGVVDVVLDGETGLLVTPGNVEELARAILRLASDGKLARRLTETACERLKTEFTMERNVRQIQEIYECLR